MTREEVNIQDAIHCVKVDLEEAVCEECRLYGLCHTICKDADRIKLEALEKQIQWQKTDRFNRMIEAFECDFSLIQQGEKTFAQLDENLKVEKVNVNSLRKDMDLMQELSYLIRHGKAEIWLKEGE